MDWAVKLIVFPLFVGLLGTVMWLVLNKIGDVFAQFLPTYAIYFLCKTCFIPAFNAYLSGYIAAWAANAILRFWRG
jgi:hypothetical protein